MADDKIFLKSLEAECIIGVFRWERLRKQRVRIDLEVPCDTRKSARKDRVAGTVDYKRIAKTVLHLVERSRFFLVESLAETIARRILEDFRIPYVTVSVSKPGAVRFSRNVGVIITRYAHRAVRATQKKPVFISLGSNRKKRASIWRALDAVRENFCLRSVSGIYECAPWGKSAGSKRFWNAVCEIETDLSPRMLKARLLQLEQVLGRRRVKNKFAPRVIDLDVVYYGSSCLKQRRFSIPHPESHQVPYLLLPMAEIAPNFVHPVKKKTMIELVGGLLDGKDGFKRVRLESMGGNKKTRQPDKKAVGFGKKNKQRDD